MFSLKDKVVYPGHGIAVIDDIVEKKVLNVNINFFKLSFLYKDTTILIPVQSIENTGIRYPSTKEVIGKVKDELYKPPKKRLEFLDFTPSGWNRRNKEYQLKIQGGDIIEIAQIFRDLMYVAQQKELSFGEKNLLQAAEELLIQEIQLVTERQRDFVVQELHDPFKQIFFHETRQQVSSSPA